MSEKWIGFDSNGNTVAEYPDRHAADKALRRWEVAAISPKRQPKPADPQGDQG